VHSEPLTTTHRQKTKQQSKQLKQPPNPHIQYSKQQQKSTNSNQKDPNYKEQQTPSSPTQSKELGRLLMYGFYSSGLNTWVLTNGQVKT
jgi:hypothetical protein